MSLTEDVVLELRFKARRKFFSYSATWGNTQNKNKGLTDSI